jgi:hypothetical protein
LTQRPHCGNHRPTGSLLNETPGSDRGDIQQPRGSMSREGRRRPRSAKTTTQGERCRDLVAPWSNTNVKGEILTVGSLSTRLTKVAAYRQTICGVEAFDYLVRRINAVEEPVVAEARIAKAAMVASAVELIAGLHWRDFEVLCDLIFSRSGCRALPNWAGCRRTPIW